MNPPQERNLAEAEETYIVRLIKLLPEYGVMSKERQEAVISLVNQAETEALAKREQETVKGCLEEARRMNYHGECVNCKCIVPNQMINAIKVKYPTKE